MPSNSRDERTDTQVPGRHRTARLVTPWTFADRINVECEKAEGAPFALLVVQIADGAARSSMQVFDELERPRNRIDLVTQIGVNRYAFLLTGAGRYDAGLAAHRLKAGLPDARAGVVVYPEDGADLGELVSSALAALRPPTLRGGYLISGGNSGAHQPDAGEARNAA